MSQTAGLTARKLSTHAAVASIVRKHLKSLGIACEARSESFAGGNAVRVKVVDQNPETIESIKSFCSTYQAGHFNGMDDIYEYDNCSKDIPQVKYLTVSNQASESLRQKIWDYARGHYAGLESAPEAVKDAGMFFSANWDLYGSEIVYRVFTGAMGDFWKHQQQ